MIFEYRPLRTLWDFKHEHLNGTDHKGYQMMQKKMIFQMVYNTYVYILKMVWILNYVALLFLMGLYHSNWSILIIVRFPYTIMGRFSDFHITLQVITAFINPVIIAQHHRTASSHCNISPQHHIKPTWISQHCSLYITYTIINLIKLCNINYKLIFHNSVSRMSVDVVLIELYYTWVYIIICILIVICL